MSVAQRIQRGELPARTFRELVDAQRQNFAGAGFDLSTLRLLLEREGVESKAVWDSLDRLEDHLTRASDKATLAVRHEALA